MNTLEHQQVVSRDGTPIEYLSVCGPRAGDQPGVILIPGALAIASDLSGLASLLAPDFSVHIIQRRGRGASGPQGDHYSIQSECDDVAAVRAATGATLLFGHSFGGLVALQAARSDPSIVAVAVYEPGVSVDRSVPVDWIPRAQQQLDRGDAMGAFVTFARGVNPSQTGRVPAAALRLILKSVMPAAELEQKLALMPQAVCEHSEVGKLDSALDHYRGTRARVLIMQGDVKKSRRKTSPMRLLAEAIPQSDLVEFPGLNHFAPEEHPDVLAARISMFFGGH
jgi:pimeloyl-ACP methyl ester carboxylesterase